MGSLLEYAFDHNLARVALGFNQPEQVDPVHVERWAGTFADVLCRMLGDASRSSVVMHPTVGPEPITGSTRAWAGLGSRTRPPSRLNSVAHQG